MKFAFEGDISLGDESGVYAPAKPKGPAKPEDRDPLDEIIERINEKYKGSFTEPSFFPELNRSSAFSIFCNNFYKNLRFLSKNALPFGIPCDIL